MPSATSRTADRTALRRAAVPLGIGAGLAAGAAALALRDPHQAASWGTCPFLALTGLPCPLCGGLRAVFDLEHGRVVGALGENALVVLALPLVVGWLVLWARRAPAVPDVASAAPRIPRAVLVVALVVVVAFTVLRWTPALAWFAP